MGKLDIWRKVGEGILADRDNYDQSTWGNGCGTPRCIAGWAVTFHDDHDCDIGQSNYIEEIGASVLGIGGGAMPDIFREDWPDALIEIALNPTDELEELYEPYGYENTVPTAEEARDLCIAVASGRIPLEWVISFDAFFQDLDDAYAEAEDHESDE